MRKVRILILLDRFNQKETWLLRKAIFGKAVPIRHRFYILLDGAEVPEEIRGKVAVLEREIAEGEYLQYLEKYLRRMVKELEKFLQRPVYNLIPGQVKKAEVGLRYSKPFPELHKRFAEIKARLEEEYRLQKIAQRSEFLRLKVAIEELEEKRARGRLSDEDLLKLVSIKDELEAKIEFLTQLLDKAERLLSASYRPVENEYKCNKI